jgi:hypothetical protein
LLDFSRYFSGAVFCCFWRCCQVAILLPVPWRDYIEYLNSNAILICTRLWSRGIFVRKNGWKETGTSFARPRGTFATCFLEGRNSRMHPLLNLVRKNSLSRMFSILVFHQ